jgi:hypothetical protein
MKDLYLHGRMYTWSNERESPTLTRIDRALVSVDWDLLHPDAFLQALSSSVSDHASIHLGLSAAFRPKRRFKFEAFGSSWRVSMRCLRRLGDVTLGSSILSSVWMPYSVTRRSSYSHGDRGGLVM